MKFSKFIFLFEEQSCYICFNSVLGKIVKLGKKTIDGETIVKKQFTEEQLNYLKSNYFIVNNDEEDLQIVKLFHCNSKTLYLTIEITTACNFECAFCYQHNWNFRAKIKMSDIKKLLNIIQASNLTNYNEINIDFIGGEPFLFKEIVLKIYKEFKSFCGISNLRLSIKLNTNGTFLDSKTLNEFENAIIMLPFLAPSDYGNIVKFKNNGSKISLYNLLFDKISSWVPTLNQSKSILLSFRYNVNHLNVDYIPTFFEIISSFGIKSYEVDIVNTANLGGIFQNKLTETEFMNIYFDTIIPLCKKYGIKHPIRPRCEISRCKARHSGSLKLFADGKIGLCNGLFLEKNARHISSISQLNDIDDIYSEIKSYNYIKDEPQCHNCRYIFLCGGPSPCRSHKCPFNVSNLKRYIYSIIH